MKIKGNGLKFYFLLIVILGACSSASSFEEKDLSKKLHILFIGNSLTYSNNLPAIIENLLAKTEIEDLKIETVALPNYGLQDHWANDDARPKIATGRWDVVVLQQGPSATEGRPSLLEYSKKFSEKILKVGAIPALYMVWPSNYRSFDFDGVSESYQMAAHQVNGLLFPAGEAWRIAWKVDATIQLYSGDDFHPSLTGSYLAALVMFNRLTNYDLSTLPSSIPTESGNVALSSEIAQILYEAAIKANKQFN